MAVRRASKGTKATWDGHGARLLMVSAAATADEDQGLIQAM
jgi:hypothetical protein